MRPTETYSSPYMQSSYYGSSGLNTHSPYHSTQVSPTYTSPYTSNYGYSGYSGYTGSYASDQMNERNIDHLTDERRMKLMQQTTAEKDLERAKLYGQD
jgi:hypothetical protein